MIPTLPPVLDPFCVLSFVPSAVEVPRVWPVARLSLWLSLLLVVRVALADALPLLSCVPVDPFPPVSSPQAPPTSGAIETKIRTTLVMRSRLSHPPARVQREHSRPHPRRAPW